MNSESNPQQVPPFESHTIPYQAGCLHLAHAPAQAHSAQPSVAKPQVLMLHGAIENGKIFHSRSGKGLGPFLAQAGFDVWVADLYGRGQSLPAIDSASAHGQTESISEQIPLLLDYLEQSNSKSPQFWVAHSWGGVLLMSALARYPQYNQRLKGIVFFGTKRQVTVQNTQKWLRVDLFWKNLARLIAYQQGFLPARKLKVGSDSETRKSLSQSIAWVKAGSRWQDSQDGFDYAQAIQALDLPAMLFLAGPQDPCLGHPVDVQVFMHELPARHADYWLLSKSQGFAHDYGHIDMLTHPGANQDHFPQIAAWMHKQL